MATNNQQTRLVQIFNTGKPFTTTRLANKLNTSESRVRFLVTELRQSGYAVYRNRVRKAGKRVTNAYRLGTPSRKMVAFAAKYGGDSYFSTGSYYSPR